MNILIFILIFLFGTIIGSFLNVVIFRFNTGKTMVNSRSICMTCNRNLRWFELVPIFSFLIQGGKCRRCKESISYQYPLVEFITGIIFILVAQHFQNVLFFSPSSYIFLITFFSFLFSILVVISVYDLRHKVIPDKLVYFYIFVSFISIFVNTRGFGHLFFIPSLSFFLAGPVLALPFALIWLFSKGRWMGLGDAKLMLGLGWMLGFYFGLASLVLAFWIGAIVGLLIMFFSHNKINMKTEIPFAPFLIISALIVFFLSLDIFTLSLLFKF